MQNLETFIAFFENLGNGQKLLWIAFCLGLFWLLEGAFPLFRDQLEKWRHAKVNLVLLATTVMINALFGLATAGIFIWASIHSVGLLYWVAWPLWLEVLIGVMILDLIAQYLVHFLLHRVKFMWRFHMVHHSDTAVDVTSGTRHHPGDFVLRETFALLAILIGGMPFGIYALYRVLTILMTYWTHANLKMPRGLDKFLSLVIVTPNMHKFHHHFERPWTDTNFGNIFSIWDRIFRTYVYDDLDKIRYGLDVLDDNTSQDILYQLKIPFDGSIKTDY